MTQLSKILYDAQIELGLDLERVSASARGDVLRLLKVLEKELIGKVSAGVTDWQKARIAKLLSETKAAIQSAYDTAQGVALDTTTTVAQVSATATAESLSLSLGGAIKGVLPTSAYLETVAGSAIVQGATQADWWARQGQDTAWRFSSAVRQGLVQGETTQQIVQRVRQVMDGSRRNAEALVRTSVQTVAAQTREKTFDANADIMASVEWVAALDARVCLECAALDGKRWDYETKKPIGHSIPYKIPAIHFGDRCMVVPVTKTFRELGIDIDIDEVADGTRVSMTGQVSDKTFGDWLKRQPADRVEDILGKGRADLYQRGVITFNQLVDGNGSPLTLKRLREKYVDK